MEENKECFQYLLHRDYIVRVVCVIVICAGAAIGFGVRMLQCNVGGDIADVIEATVAVIEQLEIS